MSLVSIELIKLFSRGGIYVVGFDCDGVLYNTVPELARLVQVAGHTNLDLTDWNLGIERADLAVVHDEAVMNGLFLRLDIHADAVYTAQELSRRGYDVPCVTNRGTMRGNAVVKERSRMDTLTSVGRHSIPSGDSTHFVDGSKLPKCVELGIDVVFEDSPKICAELWGQRNCYGRPIRPILVNRPWNEKADYPFRVDCPSHTLPYLTGPS